MKHCWHGTNEMLLTNPPQFPEFCCFCGVKRNRTYMIQKLEGHGRYAEHLTREVEVTPQDDEECPARKGE